MIPGAEDKKSREAADSRTFHITFSLRAVATKMEVVERSVRPIQRLEGANEGPRCQHAASIDPNRGQPRRLRDLRPTRVGSVPHRDELPRVSLGVRLACLIEMLDRRLGACEIAEPDAAQAEHEQLVDIVEEARPFHLRPVATFDHEARAHRGELALERQGPKPTAYFALDMLTV